MADNPNFGNVNNTAFLYSNVGRGYKFIFPPNYGNSGEQLTTDGAGTLTWVAGAGGVIPLNNYGVISDTFVGNSSGFNSPPGANNTAVGYQTMSAILTGATGNTAMGTGSMQGLQAGDRNTAYGYNSLNAITNGTDNVAIGCNALDSCTTATNNTAVGYNALQALTTSGVNSGDSNTAVGYEALKLNTANNNTAIGRSALTANVTGLRCTAVGYNSLTSSTADDNLAMGHQSAENTVGGNFNVAIGNNALRLNISGVSNTAVGYHALPGGTGSGNLAIGYLAGSEITNGNNNTLINSGGGSTPSINTSGSVVIGYSAEELVSADNQLIIKLGGDAGVNYVRTQLIPQAITGGYSETQTLPITISGTNYYIGLSLVG